MQQNYDQWCKSSIWGLGDKTTLNDLALEHAPEKIIDDNFSARLWMWCSILTGILVQQELIRLDSKDESKKRLPVQLTLMRCSVNIIQVSSQDYRLLKSSNIFFKQSWCFFVLGILGGGRDLPIFWQGTNVVNDLPVTRPNKFYCFWGSNPSTSRVSCWSKPAFELPF